MANLFCYYLYEWHLHKIESFDLDVLTCDKIIEIFLQCIPYTGFPRVLNGVFLAKEIFHEQKVK